MELLFRLLVQFYFAQVNSHVKVLPSFFGFFWSVSSDSPAFILLCSLVWIGGSPLCSIMCLRVGFTRTESASSGAGLANTIVAWPPLVLWQLHTHIFLHKPLQATHPNPDDRLDQPIAFCSEETLDLETLCSTTRSVSSTLFKRL